MYKLLAYVAFVDLILSMFQSKTCIAFLIGKIYMSRINETLFSWYLFYPRWFEKVDGFLFFFGDCIH